MERIFFRERQMPSSDDPSKSQAFSSVHQRMSSRQLNIAVTGLGRSVGTTFVATALAFYFRDKGKTVSFCQCLTPSKAGSLLYDAVAMDQRFARREFCDVYERIHASEPLRFAATGAGWGKQKEKLLNTEEGISWILPTGQSSRADAIGHNGMDLAQTDLTEAQQARLLTIPRGEVCVFDFEADNQWNQTLMDMDVIIVVVDPLPSKMIHSKERFKFLKKLELAGCIVVWVVNYVNRGINLRQVKAYLKTNQIIRVPTFQAELIYECEYACRFPWENAEIQRKMMEICLWCVIFFLFIMYRCDIYFVVKEDIM